MVRLAKDSDVPFIVTHMLMLKPLGGWAQYDQPGYNETSLQEFVRQQLYSHQSVCYVYEDATNGLLAFCAGGLSNLCLPPQPKFIFEWGWAGTKREAIMCWRAVKMWGKKQGATLSCRWQSIPGTHCTRFEERQIWKVL